MTAPAQVVAVTSRTQQRSRRTWLVSQFGQPRGVAGRLAGWVMAHRPSNRRRNAWTVELLDLQPGGRVLEIGFGPGLSLHWTASRVGPTGFVAGIDRSDTMLRQAQRRNRVAVASGQMDLRVASVTNLPDFGTSFDAALAVNTIGFWPDLPSQFRHIHERLASGGRFAVTMQPRSKKATAATTERMRHEIEADLYSAGFVSVTAHTLELEPPAVCVIGVRAGAGSVVNGDHAANDDAASLIPDPGRSLPLPALAPKARNIPGTTIGSGITKASRTNS